MAKNYNSSKSNTSGSISPEDEKPIDLEPTDPTTKNYNSSKSNTSEISVEDDLVGEGGSGGVDHNSTRSNNGLAGEGGDGGGPGEPAMIKNYNSSKSNTSSISVEDDLAGEGGSGAVDHNSTRSNNGLAGEGGGSTSTAHEAAHVVQQRASGHHDTAKASINNIRATSGGSGSGTGVIGSTFGLAKTILTAAVLLTAAGVGFDLYETYNDAIDLNLEDHVTDADFALNGDKTEINGDISFNIPEMGRFEKKILAQVHVTVLESSPTTTGDYSFEYTLGSGEQTYKFSLTNLDPVTVGKINAGEDLELEYTTSITVIYLGVELAPATTDMPAKTVTVETA